MPDRSERELFEAVLAGDNQAFERIYDRYQQRTRLMAWRVSHRPDWVDDLVNETWFRAFRMRKTYKPDRPFAVWMAGILQNVYREHCRKSPTTLDSAAEVAQAAVGDIEDQSPEKIAAEAEVLEGLNECIARLDGPDTRIIRLRFFDGLTLRAISKEVALPESTIREIRLPAAYTALRKCLDKKGIRLSEVFPAQDPGSRQ
jgi:RNA polymerase sigma-70 factor (ECF subfamily)